MTPRRLVVLAAGVCLSSCELNSAVALAPCKPAASPGRAVIAFSVALEAPWPYRGLSVELDRYDLKKQDVSGNCLHFERMTGSITPAAVGSKTYFTFNVAPGAYSYSRLNGTTLNGPPRAFVAPEGKVTFIGDFAYVGTRSGLPVKVGDLDDPRMELTIDLPAAERRLGVPLVAAQVVEVAAPHPFLCTP